MVSDKSLIYEKVIADPIATDPAQWICYTTISLVYIWIDPI